MFRKANPTTDVTTASKPTKTRETIPSIITHEVHILGNMVSDSSVDFSGTIDGNIRCDVLTLRESGTVKGEIVANSVFVHGTVNGLIKAKNVNLLATCKVEGVIIHGALTIEDGAFVDGKFKRSDRVSVAVANDSGSHKEEDTGNTSDTSGLDAFGGPVLTRSANGSVKLMENIRLIR